jgi:hypothetical protein
MMIEIRKNIQQQISLIRESEQQEEEHEREREREREERERDQRRNIAPSREEAPHSPSAPSWEDPEKGWSRG